MNAPLQPDNSPTLGEVLGLGQAWQSGPAAFSWGEISAPDGTRGHILRIQTTAGIFAIALDNNGLAELIAQAQARHSGLTIATASVLR